MNIAPIVILVAVAALSSCLTLVLTAAVRVVARRVGMVDQPDGHRKLHAGATPLGGGVAIYLATVAVITVLLVTDNRWHDLLWANCGALAGLLLAGLVIVIGGVVDDIFKLAGRQKLFLQCVAATIIMAFGLTIENVGIFGKVIDLGILALPLTLFWLLGAINSVNLLDGIDGLATTVGIILAATLGIMALISLGEDSGNGNPTDATLVADSGDGNTADATAVVDSGDGNPADTTAVAGSTDGNPATVTAVVAVVFTGSLLGFLHFNFPPARVFLGDSGSMLIGLVVGSLAILGSLKGGGTVLLAAPLAVWTIPILDSAAAVLRRRLSGRSIYVTDRAHLHHRLLSLLGSNRKVLGVIAVCCAFTSSAALISVYYETDLIAMLGAIAVVVVFIVTGIFGRAELLLLTSRLRHVGHSLIANPGSGEHSIAETSVRLQGSRKWELLWETLTDAAETLSLSKIHLDLNLPAMQEGYNATWTRSAGDDSSLSWQLDIPLVVDKSPVGRLHIVCACNGLSVCEQLERLVILLEPFDTDLRSLTGTSPAGCDADGADESGGQHRHAKPDVLTSDS